jgi:hypothetical protein
MSRLPLPPPRAVPWNLKPFSSARTSLTYDGYGRMVASIEHELLRGITPVMLAWWFRNIGGECEIGGQRLNKYLAWHPTDHILWELDREAPGGGAGIGARFRIVEIFNGNPDHYIDVVETVQRLDETGLTLVNRIIGVEVSRLNHDFIATEEGTLYRSTLTIGTAFPVLKGLLNPLMHRYVMSEEKARSWLRHNVEEVGAFEHMLPLIYPGSSGTPRG